MRFDAGLDAYLPELHLEWLAAPEPRWRVVDGTVVFLDISGFTPLTERLARRGKAGAEELTDHLNAVFGALIAVARDLGGDVVKFGGDALLFLFTGERHRRRADAAAWDMQAAMRPFRQLRTSAGTVELQASAGLASGPVDLFLAGGAYAELVVAGPTVTRCLQLEARARAGQVLRPGGHPLERRPEPGTWRSAANGAGADPALGLPATLRGELGAGFEGEHRQAVVGFVQLRGVDELLAAEGHAAASAVLDDVLGHVQAACERHAVTPLGTDVDAGPVKVILIAGAPRAGDDDAGRMLRALREIVARPGRLRIRAGVNRGRVFIADLGDTARRCYTAMGDATNLAARLMARAPDGQVLATVHTIDAARVAFTARTPEPIRVKGKSEPVTAALVGPPHAGDDALTARAAGGHRAPVAREAETDRLVALVDAAAAGRAQTVELRGEPGMGKSCLVDVVLARAVRGGVAVVYAEGAAHEMHVPFAALRAPLRRLLGVPAEAEAAAVVRALLAAADDHIEDAADWLGVLAPLVGIDVPLSERARRLDAEAIRGRRIAALTELLAGVLGPAGVLVVIDDAHWLDAASADVLAALLASPALAGWSVLGAQRPGPDVLRLGERYGRELIELGPLPAAAAKTLVLAGGSDGGHVPPDAVAALVARGGGNPLMLREMAAAVRAGGAVDDLPDQVEGVLSAAVDRLPLEARRSLRRAAVLGTRFSRTTLAALLALDDETTQARVRELAGFLIPEGDHIRFRHPLLRAAAYEALPYRRRRELHGTALDVLRSADEDEVETLALHSHHAGRSEDAWRYARAGAERALERGAPTDALTMFAWAVAAGTQLDAVDAGALAGVHEACGDAADLAGRYEEAARSYAQARRLRAGDPLAVAALYRKEGRMCERRGRYPQALACATRGSHALAAAAPGAARRRIAGMLEDVAGSARLRQGRTMDALRHLAAAVELLADTDEAAALAHASYALASAHTELGDVDRADALGRRALTLYEQAGDLPGAATVLGNLGIDAYWLGHWQEAAELLERSRAMRVEVGDVALTAESELNLAELWSDQGRWDEAEPLLEEARAIFLAAPRPEGAGLATSDLGRLAARRGDTERAMALLEEAKRILAEIGADGLLLEAEVRVAECRALAGDARAALEAADATRERALAVPAGRFYLATLDRVAGWALSGLGMAGEARRRLERSVQHAREADSAYELAVSEHELARLAARERRPEPEREARAAAALAALGVVRLAAPAEGAAAGPRRFVADHTLASEAPT